MNARAPYVSLYGVVQSRIPQFARNEAARSVITKGPKQDFGMTAPETNWIGCLLDGDGNESFVAPQLPSFTLLGRTVPATVTFPNLPACTCAEVDGEIILELAEALINGVDEAPKFSYRDAHSGGACFENLAKMPLLGDGVTLIEVGFVAGLEQHSFVLDAVESGDIVMVDRRTPTTVMVTCDVSSFVKSFRPP